jgi:hypothetical protein
MVNEADRYGAEDKAKREAVETKNNAESMVYQTEKQVKELGDKVRAPQHIAQHSTAQSALVAIPQGRICYDVIHHASQYDCGAMWTLVCGT